MDFRKASQQLEQQDLSQEDLARQIVNLPCLYGIFKDRSELFCLEVFNKAAEADITVALVYSSLELAISAVQRFEIPSNWFIAQWPQVHDALQACIDVGTDGIAFDSLPEENNLSGLIVDRESIQDLLWMSLETQ